MRPREGAHEDGREQAHVAGQADELDAVLPQQADQLGVELLARPAAVVAEGRRDSRARARARGRAPPRHSRTTSDDLAAELAALLRVDQGLQVRAPAADEDADVFVVGSLEDDPEPRDDRADDEARLAPPLERVLDVVQVLGETTTTMPMPMLKVRYISSSGTAPPFWISRKSGGTCQEPRRSRAPRPSGSTRGMLPGKPPPVMWASARTLSRSRSGSRAAR